MHAGCTASGRNIEGLKLPGPELTGCSCGVRIQHGSGGVYSLHSISQHMQGANTEVSA